jgi:ATP-binding cassette subfamily F protein 3
MLTFRDVSLRRGGRLLFDKASFVVHDGERVGVTGANGSGKSSLFALITGEVEADAGEVSLAAGRVLSIVVQEIDPGDRSALDFVIDGDGELRAIEADLARSERDGDGENQARLLARFEAIGGYGAKARAAKLLHGLGFAPADGARAVADLSGGWRMRLNLARALMTRSDLLLLDEPTNHLDVEAVVWLETWLKGYPGTLMVISHDRDFLDRAIGRVLHIDSGSIGSWNGNYSAFERQRAEALAVHQASLERQQREIAHIESFVRRFRAKASKARQAQSRLKALERMERLAPLHARSPFRFRIPAPRRLPNPLLRLEDAVIGYDGRPLVADIRFSLQPGQRIALLGPNGVGKSTFIRLLAGELAPLSGRHERASHLQVGYFAQHQLEQLDPGLTVLEQMSRQDPERPAREVRDFLGGFGFGGERTDQLVDSLSGGEKARLVLAMIVRARPNLLLLDEPTNHLDIDMRDALSLALQEFDGALVVVAHDRYLLRAVTDEFWVIGGGRLARFDGDLDDYGDWLRQRPSQARDETGSGRRERGSAARSRRRDEAGIRRALRPLKQRARTLELRLGDLNGELRRIEHALADAGLYREQRRAELVDLGRRQAELRRLLARTEEDWYAVAEQIEIGSADDNES